MRSPLWLTTFFVTASFLSACGGGSSDASQVNASCSLKLSVYANGSSDKSSGYAIQQGGAATPAVSRQLEGCAIKSLESARLSMCIRHSKPEELNAQLIAPVIGQILTRLNANDAATEEDKDFCRFNGGAVYAMDIPTEALAGLPSLNVGWNVAVIDTSENNQTGSFISWSLLLSGKK
jgi:hypothetical protein